MGRVIQNYFDGATDTSEGIVAGLSRTWYGNGDIELVTLDNPSSAACIMERREFGVPTAAWVAAGGMTRTSVTRLNLFSAGFEFRARLLESAPAQPVRLTIRTLDQIHRGLRQDVVVESFSRGHIVGFADPEAKGIIEYGDYEALKETTAFMFFCYDPDPTLLANFGGAWEKYGVDYRKIHVNSTQFLLSVAIENYIADGQGGTGGGTGGGGGGGNEGEVGGPPVVRAGSPSLVASPAGSVSLQIYSSVLGEILWGDPIDEDPALDKYEVSVSSGGGALTIVYIGNGNSYVLPNLSPATQYTASIVRYRDSGEYSAPFTASSATPVTGTGGGGGGSVGGGGSTPVDGASTTYNFVSVDMFLRSYVEAGMGGPAQIWQQATTLPNYTGDGYLTTSNVNVTLAEGALAVYLNQVVDTLNDRRIWVRCRAETAGDQFGITSQGNGTVSIITVTNVDWVWVQASNNWKALDASMHLRGIDGGVSIDRVIVQNLNDLTIPTGLQGLKLVV